MDPSVLHNFTLPNHVFIMFPYKFAKRNIRMTTKHAYIVENKRHFIQAKKAEYKGTERSKTRINFVYA